MKDIQGIIGHSLEEARDELDRFMADPETIPAIDRDHVSRKVG